MSAAFAPLTRVKRWQFQWKNVLVDNNGTFNRDNFPNAFYIDKNPGNYTVKIYNKGVQIRELEFTVGSDGRFAKPGYSDQVFIPYYTVVLPVKVTSPEEKWNATAWKTESFYANPVSGFGLQ
jgi:restriction endonuclease S subunit